MLILFSRIFLNSISSFRQKINVYSYVRKVILIYLLLRNLIPHQNWSNSISRVFDFPDFTLFESYRSNFHQTSPMLFAIILNTITYCQEPLTNSSDVVRLRPKTTPLLVIIDASAGTSYFAPSIVSITIISASTPSSSIL